MASNEPLPYEDTEPIGAADFYFAINATFRFVFHKFGMDGLQKYWAELGSTYFAPVSKQWQQGGLSAVADYWKAFFAAEPGAEVVVESAENSVAVDVKTCPAIRHLREHQREILPCFCRHCYFISEAMAASAGLTVRVEGGNGTCWSAIHQVLEEEARMSPSTG